MTLMRIEDTEVLGLEGSSGDPPDASMSGVAATVTALQELRLPFRSDSCRSAALPST